MQTDSVNKRNIRMKFILAFSARCNLSADSIFMYFRLVEKVKNIQIPWNCLLSAVLWICIKYNEVVEISANDLCYLAAIDNRNMLIEAELLILKHLKYKIL